MTVAEKPKKQRSYTLEQVEAGLHALAIAAGNHKMAARLLAEHDQHIPPTTLYEWKKRHATRYQEIEAQALPQIRERMARESEALAVAYAHIEREALERLGDKMDELKPSDLTNVATRIATSRGISVDKASVLRGMPDHISGEVRNADEILRSLGKAVQGLVIEGTGVEIEPKTIAPKPSAIRTDTTE